MLTERPATSSDATRPPWRGGDQRQRPGGRGDLADGLWPVHRVLLSSGRITPANAGRVSIIASCSVNPSCKSNASRSRKAGARPHNGSDAADSRDHADRSSVRLTLRGGRVQPAGWQGLASSGCNHPPAVERACERGPIPVRDRVFFPGGSGVASGRAYSPGSDATKPDKARIEHPGAWTDDPVSSALVATDELW